MRGSTGCVQLGALHDLQLGTLRFLTGCVQLSAIRALRDSAKQGTLPVYQAVFRKAPCVFDDTVFSKVFCVFSKVFCVLSKLRVVRRFACVASCVHQGALNVYPVAFSHASNA